MVKVLLYHGRYRRFAFIVFSLVLPAAGAATAWAAPDGTKLYTQHCAACHGSRGTGGVGVPLALPDFLAQADDDYLRKTIRLGRPGRVMPAFRQLSDADVDTIVGHIRDLAPVKTATETARFRPGKGNIGRGEKLYLDRCAACHGNRGEGGHGTGVTFSRPRDLPVLAPALNNPGFLAAASDDMIKTTLMRGRRGTPMRSFLEQGLTERDIDDVVAYVRSLAQQSVAGTASAADEPPVLVRVSPYDMDKTVERLKAAIGGANMRLIRTESFDRAFFEDGKENKRHVVVDSCDFAFLNQALKIDPRVGLFLPCRFTLSEHGGKVTVGTINPKRLSAIFNNVELDRLCDQMHKVYVDILEEATF